MAESKLVRRDIVVIGASAGGVETLLQLVAGFPSDLSASVFIAIHMHPGFISSLPRLLSNAGPLPASAPRNGEPFEPGHIYVASPDRHLTLMRGGRIEVARGPRENGHRPSVDALFRTAARGYGARVMGVVLTGYLNCGTAGLLSVKARGGLALVQDPADAIAPDMPRSAIETVAVDYVLPVRDLATALVRLSREEVLARLQPVGQGVLQMEEHGAVTQPQSEVVCPNCQGNLTVSDVDGFLMFRCHVGHAFSLQSLSAEQADEVERALWGSIRALDEAATLSHRLADTTAGEIRERFLEKESAQRDHANVIRRIVLGGDLLSRDDSYGLEKSEPRLVSRSGPTTPSDGVNDAE